MTAEVKIRKQFDDSGRSAWKIVYVVMVQGEDVAVCSSDKWAQILTNCLNRMFAESKVRNP